jgi:lysozyme family protein
MNFDLAFDRLMGNEGGYVNNPADPGGETNWGIAKRSYPDIDIASLTREQAKAVYQRDFWIRGQMDKLPPAVAFQAFDIAVNCGIETAIRMLQRAVGVAEDGHIGPVTLAAVAAKPLGDVLMLVVAERLDFYAKLTRFDTFGRGWTRRCAKDLRYAAQDA